MEQTERTNFSKPNGDQRTFKRVKTPTVLQMEAVECGAAALAIILAYYKSYIPLEELRVECGVSRDGSKAVNILKAARKYGLIAKGFKKEPEELRKLKGPMIIHWNFNHFLVLEGFKKDRVYLNDPAHGPRVVTYEEFDQSYTGVVITFEPSQEFKIQGEKRSMITALKTRMKGSEVALIFVVLAGLALVIPGIIIPTFTKIFVDNILLGEMQHWLFPLLIGMGLTAILRGALTWLQQYYLLRLETKIALNSSSNFFWHVLRLPIEFFSQRSGGDISSRVMINDRVAQLVSGELANAVLSSIMIVFYLILMFQYSVLLTFVGIFIALINVLFLKLVARKRSDQSQKLIQESGKLQGISMGGIQVIETLKSSGSESDFFTKWAGHQSKLLNSEQEMGVSSQLLSAVPTFLSALTTTVILAVGGLQVLDGVLTIGMLVAFQSLMASFISPVNKLVQLGSTLQEVEGNMNRLDDVLNYPLDSQFTESEEPEELDINKAKLSGFVELKNVTFGYNKLEGPLIENFNLCLKPGDRVALVGGSGSGKSTISKLIAGVYQPWSGEILFDGKPRSELPRSLVCNSLSVVDQDISMFEGTVKENLTLWDYTIEEHDVFMAAKDASIHDEITNRNGGYDYLLEEGGANFSGGQRQRLEIARALVGNPTVLVLDEATSALDSKTEKWIDDSFKRRGCTCIIVAHRLSTIRDADEIIVMDRGSVVERGTHTEMMKSDGYYSRLIAQH